MVLTIWSVIDNSKSVKIFRTNFMEQKMKVVVDFIYMSRYAWTPPLSVDCKSEFPLQTGPWGGLL